MATRNETVPEAQLIQFRIGINLGDVIIEDDDIYGGGVNIAARLEGLADPGGVLISGTVFEQAEGRIDCALELIGEREVKNIERPVRVYRLLLDQAPANLAEQHTRRSAKRCLPRSQACLKSFTVFLDLLQDAPKRTRPLIMCPAPNNDF
ncbi:MAG: adenylate/guanylate cyclase domain-containing protein [Geminicoccaceae bacterium]